MNGLTKSLVGAMAVAAAVTSSYAGAPRGAHRNPAAGDKQKMTRGLRGANRPVVASDAQKLNRSASRSGVWIDIDRTTAGFTDGTSNTLTAGVRDGTSNTITEGQTFTVAPAGARPRNRAVGMDADGDFVVSPNRRSGVAGSHCYDSAGSGVAGYQDGDDHLTR